MKAYSKPVIYTNENLKCEVLCDKSTGEETNTTPQTPSVAPTCHKEWWQLPYTVTHLYDCKGKCQYYQHADGWGAVNDTCTIQYNHG